MFVSTRFCYYIAIYTTFKKTFSLSKSMLILNHEHSSIRVYIINLPKYDLNQKK